MMVRALAFLSMVMMMTSLGLAQPKAVITGPALAEAGELCVLSGMDSVCDNYQWIWPTSLRQVLVSDSNKSIGFATSRLGTYEFVLVAVDKSAKIDVARFTVTVQKGSVNPPPPIDPPPVEPPPVTPGDFRLIQEASKNGAVKLADKETASKLESQIAGIAFTVSGMSSVAEAQLKVSSTVDNVLAQRQGVSLTKDWLGQWRKPVNSEIEAAKQAGKISNTEQYSKALIAVSEGLGASVAVPTVSAITAPLPLPTYFEYSAPMILREEPVLYYDTTTPQILQSYSSCPECTQQQGLRTRRKIFPR